jgi:hypothetical protein
MSNVRNLFNGEFVQVLDRVKMAAEGCYFGVGGAQLGQKPLLRRRSKGRGLLVCSIMSLGIGTMFTH